MENCYQRLLLAGIILSAAAVGLANQAPAQTVIKSLPSTFSEFPIPTAYSQPAGITTGPDGALWFTESSANKIGRVTTAGVFTEFTIPTASNGPYGITTGSDGALWFTEPGETEYTNAIGRIPISATPANPQITEFTIPTVGAVPYNITAGPDGALWFTEVVGDANYIGRITTAGVITTFPIPTAYSNPLGITAGPDGALWFTEYYTNKIGRIPITATPANPQITEFTIPTANSRPYGITARPDAALWFTEPSECECNAKIGRITTAGVFTEFPIPNSRNVGSDSLPFGITMGPDGALWFTEYFYSTIGRIPITATAANPQITEFGPTPTAGSSPIQITAGPDGALWFTEPGANKIGRLTLAFQTQDFTATPTSGKAPLAVTFKASGLTPPMTYTVNFGDGTTGALSKDSCSGLPPIGGQSGIQCSGTASHTYNTAGSYIAALLSASDEALGSVTITVSGSVDRPNVSLNAPPQ